jgi:hypothetical protein
VLKTTKKLKDNCEAERWWEPGDEDGQLVRLLISPAFFARDDRPDRQKNLDLNDVSLVAATTDAGARGPTRVAPAVWEQAAGAACSAARALR